MFAQRLTQLRKQKGLTQEQLAENLGVTRVAISLWESAKREPDLEMFRKMANVFDVSIDDLSGSSVTRNVAASSEMAKIIRDHIDDVDKKMTPERDAMVEKITKFFANPDSPEAVAKVERLIAAGFTKENIELYIKMAEAQEKIRPPK